ncbi:MAG: hypothetical protein HY053_06235 [Proteobacteria bacterium]|nr:hypothetical protein [Pseudomonadota bacterium]
MADFYASATALRFYSHQQLEALQKHSGRRLMFLTWDDYHQLRHPKDQNQSVEEIRGWIPRNFDSDHENIRSVYFSLQDGFMASGHPGESFIIENGRVVRKVETRTWGIVVLPSRLEIALQRERTGLNIKEGLLSQGELSELGLLIGAHEVSHFALINRNQNSEAGAEMGQAVFYRQHPEFFPHLRQGNRFQAVVMGSRALHTLLAASHNYIDNYHLIPFAGIDQWRAQSDLWEKATDKSFSAFFQKTAERMHQKGDLPSATDATAFRVAYNAALHPSRHDVPPDAPPNWINYNFDKTGLLRKYLASRGITQLHGMNTRIAFNDIDVLKNLYDPSADPQKIKEAGDFMRRHNLSRREVDAFMRQGKSQGLSWVLSDKLDSLRDTTLCLEREGQCAFPRKIADPANPFLAKVIETMRDLRAEGAIAGDQAMETYTDNLFAGADFYLEPPAASTQPAPSVQPTPSEQTPPPTPERTPGAASKKTSPAPHSNQPIPRPPPTVRPGPLERPAPFPRPAPSQRGAPFTSPPPVIRPF